MTKILIVEDDEDFSGILKRVIEQDGEMSVVEVINCEEEALKRVRSPEVHQNNCVLLDLQLPFRHGDKTVSSLAGIRILEELRHQQGFYSIFMYQCKFKDWILTWSSSPSTSYRLPTCAAQNPKKAR